MGVTMTKKVLLYHIDKNDRTKIESALKAAGADWSYVARQQYSLSPGKLLGISGGAGPLAGFKPPLYTGPELKNSMMILYGFNSDELDLLLEKLKKDTLSRTVYKAVVTNTNRDWAGIYLYSMLEKEHRQMGR